MKLFEDILKEKLKSGKLKVSQGRFYLLVSVIVFYIFMGILTWAGIHSKGEVDLDSFKIVSDNIKWALMLFAGYVFGGKGLKVIEKVTSLDKKKEGEE